MKDRNSSGTELVGLIKSIAAALAVACLLYIFTFYVDGEMGIILIAFIVFAPLISLIFAIYARKRIYISFICDGYVRKGSRLDVMVTVEKTGVFPLAIVELRPEFSEVFEGSDKVYRLSLVGTDKRSFTFSVNAKTGGNGEIAIPQVYSCGFLGFIKLRIKAEEQLPPPRSVGVIPEIPEIKTSSQLFRSIADVVMTSDDDEDNDTALLFSANTAPGYEHREYVPGDPLKRVNWKLSSKKDKLMVRLDEAVASVQPMLILDLCRSSGQKPEEAVVREELLIRSTFGLLGLLVRQGIASSFVYIDSAGDTVCESVDNIDYPSQLLLKVLAIKVQTDRRVDPGQLTDSVCACVIASTDFTGDFASVTADIEDTDNVSLLGTSAAALNSTTLPLWYLDGDNNFKMV